MSPDEIYAELTEVFRDVFMDDSIGITPQTTASAIPNWNSMNHINLLLAVEMRFGFTISSREIESLNSVGDLADLIARRTA